MTTTDERTVVEASHGFGRRRWLARLSRWRSALIAGVVLVLLVTAVYLVFYSSVVTVRGVEVVGNRSVPTQQIKTAARAPIGTPLARADLAAVQARVEAIAAVRSATVSRSWLHTIRIEVTERTPVAVVSRDAGVPGSPLQAVDLDGILFGSYSSQPKGLPLIRTGPAVTAEVLSEAAQVVRSLRADIAARVKYVDVTSIDDITLRLRNGPKVLWGSADASAAKADVLAAFLGQSAHYAQIDVRTPGKPSTE